MHDDRAPLAASLAATASTPTINRHGAAANQSAIIRSNPQGTSTKSLPISTQVTTAILNTSNTNQTPSTPTHTLSTMSATSTTSFPIKLRIGRTVRRTTLPSTATWSDLLDVATTLFGPTKLDLHAAQTDGATYLNEDGDLISLSSTHELQEVLRCADQLRRDLTLTLPAANDGMNGSAWGVLGASFVGSVSSSSRASSVIVDLDGPVLEEIRANDAEQKESGEREVAAAATELVAAGEIATAVPADKPVATMETVESSKPDEPVPVVEAALLVDSAQVSLPAADADEPVDALPPLVELDQHASETHDNMDVPRPDSKSDDAVLEAAMAALDDIEEDQAEPATAATKDQLFRIPVTVIPDAPSAASTHCAPLSSTVDCAAPRATLTLGDLLSEMFGMPVFGQQYHDEQRAAAAQRQAVPDAVHRHRAALLDAERRRRAAAIEAERRRRIAALEAERQHRIYLQQLRLQQTAELERQRQQQVHARAIALQRQREFEREMVIRQQQVMAARHQAALALAVREYERAMAEEIAGLMMGGGCPFVARPSRVAMAPAAGPMMMYC
ncbi:hypothetical protein AMAG_17312 [Allomyces macrogynus ATCC 38327]|uniref:PB1 domain-containing protein n=1 Tax=Allomyces macrogynus (strain ATCC 38327) TaxID=578462 RepID=A0A0L0TE70_ALLM3|nr:hypothetical protein AMAG_17312 [Allomyces macrogynus ATCC 38327]|eukprot:KNE73042.1 hypothetical protein AMAG_17312 [Allomyces macrogynus ATCC 38327]